MVKLSRDEMLKTMITVNVAQSLNRATQLHEQKNLTFIYNTMMAL